MVFDEMTTFSLWGWFVHLHDPYSNVGWGLLLLEGPLTPKQIGTLCEDCEGLILFISAAQGTK